MALTAAGRALTQEHKIAQIRLGAQFAIAARALLAELDPARIDATLTEWAALQVLLAQAFHRDSARLAAAYLVAYRQAEAGDLADRMPLEEAGFDAVTSLHRAQMMGPMSKATIAGGTSAEEAINAVFWRLIGGWQIPVLAGGRDTIDLSSLANRESIGWRRVTDAQPCSWCAMLASRGPAYTSRHNAGQGRRWHGSCGCTVEEVFDEWQPTATEQKFIDAYYRAHQPGDSVEDVTRKMRAADNGRLLSDATT